MLQIKKYPNRRYYDATRSRHVTLQEVYQLIREVEDVCITDSKTGDDITNLILLQIVMEKDQPKLDLFPTSILHMFIRSNRQAVRQAVDTFFGPVLSMMSSTQKSIDAYVRQTMPRGMVQPIDWANSMLSAFTGPGTNGAERSAVDDGNLDDSLAENGASRSETLAALRAQLSELTERIESLSADNGGQASARHGGASGAAGPDGAAV